MIVIWGASGLISQTTVTTPMQTYCDFTLGQKTLFWQSSYTGEKSIQLYFQSTVIHKVSQRPSNSRQMTTFHKTRVLCVKLFKLLAISAYKTKKFTNINQIVGCLHLDIARFEACLTPIDSETNRRPRGSHSSTWLIWPLRVQCVLGLNNKWQKWPAFNIDVTSFFFTDLLQRW